MNAPAVPLWLASGLRTPFTKADGPLAHLDDIQLSVPVVQAMARQLASDTGPDLFVWGGVVPSLRWSNLAREVLLDSGIGPRIPAFTVVMACSTSMVGVFAAAATVGRGNAHLALVGGVDSLSNVQVGVTQRASNWLRQMAQSRSLKGLLRMAARTPLRELHLHIPRVANRSTGKSMGEHTEDMAKEWKIPRRAQDEIALASHRSAVAARDKGFFDSLIMPIAGLKADTIPRADTTLEKLAKLPPVFDTTSGRGTLSAGNSTGLNDGAAGVWLADEKGLARLPSDLPRVKLIDWELAAVDIWHEGLLMAPAYAVPRLLARHGLKYEDIALWEIHEAFAAQVLCHMAAFESRDYLRNRVGLDFDFGRFPNERMNPNGGSVAIGHPFGATGARILSQAVKELAVMPSGSRAIVSICADGGVGTVTLLETP
ncbi:MAG: acetyl-CoA C-acyltransferase [Rhodospirillaceae bacterium]|nr:MAG: acetyl-CoA C-acyltransferase [Rhodospirillaceae bacterium]